MCPPFGSVPGMKDVHERFVNVFVYPLELKGLGQFSIKYIDDTANYDVGFAYLPAFKRTIRISATTYQDNIGGSDFTYGDADALREPFGTWNFKLIGKKLVLLTEPVREIQPNLKPGGISIDPKIDWDVEMKYPRLGWTITPVYIVEAIPKDRGHMYSKKILYVTAPFYHSAVSQEIYLSDIYDRSGILWKCFYDWRGGKFIHKNGTYYTCDIGFSMHDLQTGHTSNMLVYFFGIDTGMKPETLSLKKLLQLGR